MSLSPNAHNSRHHAGLMKIRVQGHSSRLATRWCYIQILILRGTCGMRMRIEYIEKLQGEVTRQRHSTRRVTRRSPGRSPFTLIAIAWPLLIRSADMGVYRPRKGAQSPNASASDARRRLYWPLHAHFSLASSSTKFCQHLTKTSRISNASKDCTGQADALFSAC